MASTGRADVPIPNLQRQSPAVDFIENSLNKYHPAFAKPPSRYDPDLGGFIIQQTQDDSPGPSTPSITVSESHEASLVVQTTSEGDTYAPAAISSIQPRPTPQPVEALEFWDSLFPMAMSQLAKSHPSAPEHLTEARHGIREARNWTQVYDQVEKARTEYCKSNGTFRAGFQKVYRKFGDHAAEPLHRVTKLVPSGGDLGAVAVTPIIGCLQIFLEAARAASNIRKTMTEAFDGIEEMFSEIELFLLLYPGDENIEKASVDLIVSSLVAAENVIGFFLKGTVRKFVSATFKRENYERNTITSLEDIKRSCEALLQEAEKSDKYHSVHAAKVIMDRSAATQLELQRIGRDQVRRHDLRNIMHELMDEFSDNQRMLFFERDAYYRRREEELLRAVNLRLAVAEAAARSPSPVALPWGQQMNMSPVVQTRPSFDPSRILDWIDTPDLLGEDLKLITERRKVLVPEKEQARAEQLIRTGQIRQWLTVPTSSQLLVHGSYNRRAYISGLSLFCMSLSHTLAERAPRFIPLTFFCGLHAGFLGSRIHTGGRALMQSFIRQLLDRYDFSTSQVFAQELEERLIRAGDVAELCKLFDVLVRALPDNVVLCCLVDGILYFEREAYKDDISLVLVSILGLSNDSSIRAPVKVLITSPTKTTMVRQPFPDDLILTMDGMAYSGMAASSSRLSRELQLEME